MAVRTRNHIPRTSSVEGGRRPAFCGSNFLSPPDCACFMREDGRDAAAGPEQNGRKRIEISLVPLFSSVNLQADFGDFMIIFDGRFRKFLPLTKSFVQPNPAELEEFRRLVSVAGALDSHIAAYIEANPALKRPY